MKLIARLFQFHGIFKILLLLGVALVIIIPSWIMFFDTGYDATSIEAFLDPETELHSHNLIISGRALFDKMCRFEDLDRKGYLNNVLFYVPFVPENWTAGQPVKCLVIFDSGKRGWDENFSAAVKSLQVQIDSLAQINGRITITAVHHRYDLKKFEKEAMDCLRSRNELIIPDDSQIKSLIVNEKQSLTGKIFVTGLALVLVFFLVWEFKG